MNAPEKIYIPTILAANTVRYKIEGSIEYTRTDVIVKDVKRFLAEIHRVCDITDEHGYKIELRELQARFEQYMEE